MFTVMIIVMIFTLCPQRVLSFHNKKAYYGPMCSNMAIRSSSYATDDLLDAGRNLLQAGYDIVDAASYLGEYGRLEYNPSALSHSGCSISNAGRTFIAASEAFHNKNWEELVEDCLLPAADYLRVSAESFERPISLHFIGCAKSLEMASEITGCVVMARAAVSDLQEGGHHLLQGGNSMILFGHEMLQGLHVESLAGSKFLSAGKLIKDAGSSLMSFSICIDNGKLSP